MGPGLSVSRMLLQLGKQDMRRRTPTWEALEDLHKSCHALLGAGGQGDDL